MYEQFLWVLGHVLVFVLYLVLTQLRKRKIVPGTYEPHKGAIVLYEIDYISKAHLMVGF